MNSNTPKFVHFRHFQQNERPSPKGGVTVCYLPDSEGTVLAASVCSPKDNFNKSIGRKISMGRAQKGKGMVLSMQAKDREDLYKAAHEYATGILEGMSRNHRAMVSDLDIYRAENVINLKT